MNETHFSQMLFHTFSKVKRLFTYIVSQDWSTPCEPNWVRVILRYSSNNRRGHPVTSARQILFFSRQNAQWRFIPPNDAPSKPISTLQVWITLVYQCLFTRMLFESFIGCPLQ